MNQSSLDSTIVQDKDHSKTRDDLVNEINREEKRIRLSEHSQSRVRNKSFDYSKSFTDTMMNRKKSMNIAAKEGLEKQGPRILSIN